MEHREVAKLFSKPAGTRLKITFDDRAYPLVVKDLRDMVRGGLLEADEANRELLEETFERLRWETHTFEITTTGKHVHSNRDFDCLFCNAITIEVVGV